MSSRRVRSRSLADQSVFSASSSAFAAPLRLHSPPFPHSPAGRTSGITSVGERSSPMHGFRLRRHWRGWWVVTKETVLGSVEDKAPRLGAALAYYAVLA